jgi:DHA2 family multidrug resistance protein
MSAVASAAGGGAAASRARADASVNPWLIAAVVALATFMEVLDTTIANVALPYIAGGMGVSEDEASWVVTTYLVANAIILTASPFLARMVGRKRFFLICLGVFTAASVLCGFAWNLQSLLFFRILQGLGGGGMVPVSQSILADAFPPEKRGQAFALFGVAVVVAPVVGPTLGGWLSDNVSWHWCFLINGPVGLATMAAIAVLLREQPSAQGRPPPQRGVGFDLVGFVLVATFLGSLELMLDRGLEDDWFGSTFIVGTAIVCALAFVFMIPWEITRRDPMIDLRMVATRQFGACFVVMLATGAILLSTTQSLPQLTQEELGYTATWAGLALSPGGVVSMVTMFLAGRLSGKVQPKYLIIAGALVVALSMYWLTDVYSDVGFWFIAQSRMLQAFGISLVFISITAASYDGIPPEKTGQAAALINAARNTGGSIGISIFSNVLAHREQFHQSRLVETLSPSNVQYQDTLHQATTYFAAQGSSLVQAQQQAVDWIGQQVQTQAAFLGYMDGFFVLMLIALSAVPLAMMLRSVKLGGPRPVGH